jgi:type II secretory pathway component PulK
MSRRGFALLTVLWLVAALGAATATALLVARLGANTSRNRIILARADWAREACGEILLARYANDPTVRLVDTVDLGRGTWCRAELEDVAARLDVNAASAESLRRLLANDSLADALLDWRDPDDLARPHGAEAAWYRERGRRAPRNGPLADVGELMLVRGFDSALVSSLSRLLAVRGGGRLDLNAVRPELLPLVPGMGPEAAEVVLRRRMEGRPLRSTDELLSLVSPSARERVLAEYQEFTAMATYAPSRMVAALEGGVHGAAPMSRARLIVIPAAGRLAVVQREAE